MKKLVRFLGTESGIEFLENLVTAVYKRNEDVKMLFLREGEASVVEEELLENVQKMIDNGYIKEMEGYNGGYIVFSGEANVYAKATTPYDKEDIIHHSINNTNYYVLIDNENYEVVNKTSNSFTIKLKNGGESAKQDVYYVVLSQ